MTETKSYLPHFAINNKSGRWIRMDDETPHSTREKALERKKWLVDEHNKTGYRIIKHKEKFYLYEKKNLTIRPMLLIKIHLNYSLNSKSLKELLHQQLIN